MSSLMPLALVRKIDYAMLDPEVSRAEVEAGCAEAMRYDCCSVIVKPHYIEFARKLLKDTGIKVASVVGFPHGGNTTATKMYETQDIVQRGVDEIGMVVNLGALRDHDDLIVTNDITTIVRMARGRPVTIILESYLMTDEEKLRACKIGDQAGATFVQTATGLMPFGATASDIHLLRSHTRLQVKAAGRIDSLDRAMDVVEAGAARIVASHFG